MLKALIWKDVRINRAPLLIGVFLLVAPYVFVAAAVTNMPLWQEATTASAWAVLLTTGCHFSLMCSQPALAMLGGNAIAVERGDRSAEFLVYLPPSRAQVLLSKALVLGGAFLMVWGPNLLLKATAHWLSADSAASQELTVNMPLLSHLAAIGLLATGVGWCASANFNNSGPAVALGMGAPVVLAGVLQATQYAFNAPDVLAFERTYFALCEMLAPAFFLVGTITYLRRVEP